MAIVRAASKLWTEQEVKLALYLYFQLPFGQLHKGNPEIRRLADMLGRTHSSVAMKLVNFASLDPKITESGRKGLDNASNLDRSVWKSFSADWTAQVSEAESSWNALFKEPAGNQVADNVVPYSFEPYKGVSSVERIVELRVGQDFFRRAVLANFDNRCCVTGIAEPRLLNASHILPWNADVTHRHDPSNGLAMSATFDRAFDRGLIAFDEQKRLILSPILGRHPDEATRRHFAAYQGREMAAARRFEPSVKFLAWHRTSIFRSAGD